ncbi:MAG TPA: hypothetical protein VFB58_17940 [Chloroflexota bacterium]|nr:hypothetical protein [Chloroflexota bacterium]
MMAETADRPARAAGNELTPSSSAGGIWALQVLAVLVLADGSLIALGIAGAAAVGTGVSAGGVAAGLAIGLAAAVPPAVFFLAAARRVGRPNRFVPMALAASGGVWLVLWTGAGSMMESWTTYGAGCADNASICGSDYLVAQRYQLLLIALFAAATLPAALFAAWFASRRSRPDEGEQEGAR